MNMVEKPVEHENAHVARRAARYWPKTQRRLQLTGGVPIAALTVERIGADELVVIGALPVRRERDDG